MEFNLTTFSSMKFLQEIPNTNHRVAKFYPFFKYRNIIFGRKIVNDYLNIIFLFSTNGNLLFFSSSSQDETITKTRKLILYKIKRYAFHSVIGMQWKRAIIGNSYARPSPILTYTKFSAYVFSYTCHVSMTQSTVLEDQLTYDLHRHHEPAEFLR